MGFEEDFNEDLEEPESKTPVKSKTPAAKPTAGGKKLNLFFLSTIGPGEKRQKLSVDDGNNVGAIKQTVGNIFGLDPADFHLSSGGVTLDENSPLHTYNISDGDEVLLIPASTAG
ncbi:MAG: ubiquitin-like domain-containing protein [Promethearchaeota archaeon]